MAHLFHTRSFQFLLILLFAIISCGSVFSAEKVSLDAARATLKAAIAEAASSANPEAAVKAAVAAAYESVDLTDVENPATVASALATTAADAIKANFVNTSKVPVLMQAITAQAVESAISWSLAPAQKTVAPPNTLIAAIVGGVITVIGDPRSANAAAVVEKAAETAVSLGLKGFDSTGFVAALAKELNVEVSTISNLQESANTGEKTALANIAQNNANNSLINEEANKEPTLKPPVTETTEG